VKASGTRCDLDLDGISNTLNTVYQAAQDALQSTRALEGGADTSARRDNQERTSAPQVDDLPGLDDDSEWIYTDRPPSSDPS